MGVLGKALAGLGHGMAVAGEASLRERAMMLREESLMKLRGVQEQETYARNRTDALTDQEAAGKSAASAQLSKQEYESGMAAYKTSAEANIAAQKHEYDKELKRIEQTGAERVAKIKEGGGSSKFPGLKAGEIMVQGSEAPWKEMDLQRAYERNYGKFDPLGQLLAIEEGAPKYTEWRNGVVEPEFRLGKEVAEAEKPRPWPVGGKLDAATAEKLGVETKGEAIPTVKTAAEHAKLPSGARYMAPDGSVRIKQ